jgi:hypothetical protein
MFWAIMLTAPDWPESDKRGGRLRLAPGVGGIRTLSEAYQPRIDLRIGPEFTRLKSTFAEWAVDLVSAWSMR